MLAVLGMSRYFVSPNQITCILINFFSFSSGLFGGFCLICDRPVGIGKSVLIRFRAFGTLTDKHRDSDEDA